MHHDGSERSNGKPFLIGICGGSGAGKTHMAEYLQQRFAQDAVILSQDNYYKDLGPLTPEQKSQVNFDHPDAFDNDLLVRDLGTLVSDQPISVPVYDFVAAYRTGCQTLSPRRLVIVEGLFLFHMENLRERFNLKIFVDAEQPVRVRRIRYKDIMLRRQPEDLVALKIQRFVLPMHQHFIQPFMGCADIVVNNSPDDLSALRHSVDFVASQIESSCQDRQQQGDSSVRYPRQSRAGTVGQIPVIDPL